MDHFKRQAFWGFHEVPSSTQPLRNDVPAELKPRSHNISRAHFLDKKVTERRLSKAR
ncbi:hypothetical protein KIN20_008761 [Parelaphostrongylus tenuis]|uniref:Uncharacterized protein n=1 Tax=Parelaphostrongylus tenuis TaxID=148309 RepID=A0AAD5MN78_PARTN|nr:hypothetical protein KIN20_008761 [Parelaphostrongylus tenuis]